MFQIVAGPVLVGLAIAHVAVWPPLPALVHVGVLIAIAFVLVNHAVADFRKIPFTCSYLPGKLNLKVKLAPYAVGLLFVISLGSTIEYSLIKTPARVVVLSAILLAAAIQARRRWEQFASAPFQGLQFEEVDASEVAPLVLGDGSVYGKQQRYLDFIHAPPDPTFRERALRFLRRSTVVSAVACIVGVTYEHVSQRLHPVPPRIGQLVDIGGRSLNIFCSGEGSPAVIFEGGRGRPGYSWVVVQREVARFTRACWYDRAGYGWSDPAPYPHSAAVIARDLHQLLKKHGAAPPYVLVGSSFGGLVVRVYSRTYSNHVAGMVLVDSSHADFRVPITRTGFFHLDSVQRTMVCFIWLLKQTGVLRLVMQQTEERTVPQGYTENEIRLMSSFEPRTAAESFKEMELESHIQARAAGGFGNRPLIVLTAGRLQRLPTDPVDLDQLRRDEWIEVQQQLAALSTRGRQIVLADSGHGIQFDRPDAVIDAVHQVVSAVRIGR
jgi:pimeloyl-ACP methyl ester carboxylesterase